MSKIGIAYKKLVDLIELAVTPADGDFYVVTDISNGNKEKKVSASRIQHIDTSGNQAVDGNLTVAGTLSVDGRSTLNGINIISYESNTIYFEDDIVFN